MRDKCEKAGFERRAMNVDTKPPAAWLTYEEVSAYLLNQMAEEFG